MNALAETLPARKAPMRAISALGDRVDGEVRRGATAMVPVFAGYVPFACLVGVAIAGSVQPAAAWTGVWLIFAGSAHLTAIQLVDSGSGIAVTVATAVMVNARLLLLSATLAPYWRGTSVRNRLCAAAVLIDPTWLVAAPKFARSADPAAGRRFYFGASAVIWVGWAAAVTLGMIAGAVIPASVGLDLLAPLCLMSVVGARLRTAPGTACVIAAAVVAALSVQLSGPLGLLAAVVAGTAAAGIVRRLSERRTQR